MDNTEIKESKKVKKYEDENERIEAIRKHAREHYHRNRATILEKQKKYKETLRNEYKMLKTYYDETNKN